MIFRFGPARIWIRELAWLLGSWAFSWLLLSQLFGYNYLWHPQLDIQMHNTYFVFQPLLVTTLVLLPVATIVTGVRVMVSGFRHFGSTAVLLVLASVWTLLGSFIALAYLRH